MVNTKSILLVATSTILFGLSVNAGAYTFNWETITGQQVAGAQKEYCWDYSYDIGFYNSTLMIDVDIKLVLPSAPIETDDELNALIDRWEVGIESIWSTDRFFIPIAFNVDWVSSDYDYEVLIVSGPGRASARKWYTEHSWGHDNDFQDEMAAHEFGHFLSLFDEYENGAMNPFTRLIDTGGLMHTLRGGTLDYYYDPFLDWYQGKVGTAALSAPVPEPATMLLFSTGLAGLAGCSRLRKKKK